jgi:hypothetical protein
LISDFSLLRVRLRGNVPAVLGHDAASAPISGQESPPALGPDQHRRLMVRSRTLSAAVRRSMVVSSRCHYYPPGCPPAVWPARQYSPLHECYRRVLPPPQVWRLTRLEEAHRNRCEHGNSTKCFFCFFLVRKPVHSVADPNPKEYESLQIRTPVPVSL